MATSSSPSTIDNIISAANVLTGKSTSSNTVNSGGTAITNQINSGQSNTINTNSSGNTITNSGSTNTTFNSGSTNTTKNSGSVNTTQLQLSDEAVNGLVQKILEGTNGLASVSSGQKNAGLYNSSTNQLLTNDLLARTASNVAIARAPTVNTIGASSTSTDIGPSNTITNIGGSTTTTGPSSTATNNVIGPSTVGTAVVTPQTTIKNDTVVDPQIKPVTALGLLGAAQLGSSALSSIKGLTDAATSIGSTAVPTSAAIDAGVNSLGITGASSADIGSLMGTTANSTFPLGSGLSGVDAASLIAPASTGSEIATTGLVASELAAGGEAGVGITAGASTAEGVGALAATGEGVAALETGAAAIEIGAATAEGAGAAEAIVTAIAMWIVCTELNRQGRLPSRFYYYGAKEFSKYDEQGKRGYYIWAVPSVLHLRKYPNSLYSKFLCNIFNIRAEYLASIGGCKSARCTKLGAIVTHTSYAICWILSRTIAINYSFSDTAISTHGVSNGR